MAPGRRKGASKAAAAAARRQWKVGDLVLAKVKGFPPWPATVSEPEKWGYSADWRKVLVYFFGTQQIAFCNPADVEPFTEEKKESLLIKRHGKGSDFVRAVHEIIDSYEKLKKEDRVIDSNNADEVHMTNENNLAESLSKPVSKDESPPATSNSDGKVAHSSGAKSSSGVAGDVTREDDSPNEVLPPKESSVMVIETSVSSTYTSRRRLVGTQPRNRVSQRKAPSTRRTRSSRVEPNKLQGLNNYSNSAGNGTAKMSWDGSTRRSKRIRKSPEKSDRQDVDSPALVSNDGIDESDSETLTVDSDTPSINDGSTVESGCEPVEHDDANVDSRQGFDFQSNAVILKKKRKPNRKRPCNDTTEPMCKPEESTAPEADVIQISHIMPIDQEKSTEIISKEDGDEHLPLVKRARVRMGRLSCGEGPLASGGEDLDASVQAQQPRGGESDAPVGAPFTTSEERDTSMQATEELLETCNFCPEQVDGSSNCEIDGCSDHNLLLGEKNLENCSLLDQCHVKEPQAWDTRRNQQFSSSVDGEAALPPSKRLHRALEAMSANAAEDAGVVSDGPSTMRTYINGYCSSSPENYPKFSTEIGAGGGHGVHRGVESSNTSRDGASGCSSPSDPPAAEEAGEPLSETAACNKPPHSVSSSEPISCRDSVEAADCADSRDSQVCAVHEHAAQSLIVSQSPKTLSPVVTHVRPGSDFPTSITPHDEDSKILSPEMVKRLNDSDPLSGKTCLVPGFGEDDFDSSKNVTDVPIAGEAKYDEVAKLSQAPFGGDCLHNAMSKDVKETGMIMDNSISMSSPKPAEIISVACQGVHVPSSNFISVSNDHLGENKVSVSWSSSSRNDGMGSAVRVSPPNTSTCNISPDNKHSVEPHGCHTPDNPDNSKLAGKFSGSRGEGSAFLASFESVLGTLTRTKETIGRATRIAIDCAKFGVASKVIEIVAHRLETESSLHKKVDLFFLVDSIAQCSKGLKGEVGGIYPSAIQAVLPRLLSSAAPAGSSYQENRRQCLKVLRVWQERKILSESIVRHHIRELDLLCCSSSAGSHSRRQLRTERTERAFDDPIREMEGMQVDEYGSNSSFQLPGFCMPPMLRDEDGQSDSDGESFEAVTPEYNTAKPEEKAVSSATERHRHILEDVDGELEMEDVAPSCEVEISSNNNVNGVDNTQPSRNFEQTAAAPFAPPLPRDVPPSSPPLPASPPPPPPPPPPPVPPNASFCPAMSESMSAGLALKSHPNSCTSKENVQAVAHRPPKPRIPQTVSNPVHYCARDDRDSHGRAHRQAPGSDSFSSFNSRAVNYPPARAAHNSHYADGAFSKGFHLRPPHPAPSNQFSYVQADQRGQSRRNLPPNSYPNRFHTVQNSENGKYYRDRSRMKVAPYDDGDSWRSPASPFSGSGFPEGGRMPYAPATYAGPPRDPPMPNHRWAYPPRPLVHREFMPHRPASEGPIPVANRGPSYWRPM